MTPPAPSAEDLLIEAESLLRRRELAQAAAAFAAAEQHGADPDRCSAGRWLLYMLHGDFEAAWRESDSTRQRGTPHPNRLWQGEDIRGKRVIVRCLHGFGDAVHFLTYAPALRAVTATLIVEVPPALYELAPSLDGIDKVITWGEQAPATPPAWDVQIELVELPYLFRTQLAQLPIATNYLHLPTALQAAVAPHPALPGSLRVGLVWTSGEWSPSRSVPFSLLRDLLQTPGCEFWNLQGGPPRDQWTTLPPIPMLHDAPESSNTILRLAALIAQLDLVITADTLAAHLAGALGTPAWVMLEHAADWRWMHAREDSPWYPSLRLFRQATPNDWSSVIRNIQQALSDLRSQTPTRQLAAR